MKALEKEYVEAISGGIDCTKQKSVTQLQQKNERTLNRGEERTNNNGLYLSTIQKFKGSSN